MSLATPPPRLLPHAPPPTPVACLRPSSRRAVGCGPLSSLRSVVDVGAFALVAPPLFVWSCGLSHSRHFRMDARLETLICNAFSGSNAMHTYTMIPHLIKALEGLKLTTVDAIMHYKPSFVEGSIGTSDLDSLIVEIKQQWPEHKMDDAGMREGWKVLVLAARLVAGQKPDPDIFDKLQTIGLSRPEPSRGIPRGLFCKYPGQSCLITYELLNQADPTVKAVVAAEVVALVEDITCNGHGERDFTNAWCTGARLQKVNLRRAKFEGLQGTLSNVSNAELSEAALKDGYFGFSNLEGVRFQFSVLQNVGFSFSNLRHADFTRADMKNCNLYQTILTGAIFFNSNLSNASIDGAKFALYKPPGRRSAAMQPAWRGQVSAIVQYTSASLLNEYLEGDEEDEDGSDGDDDAADADDDESAVDESAEALKLKTQSKRAARKMIEEAVSAAANIMPQIQRMREEIFEWIDRLQTQEGQVRLAKIKRCARSGLQEAINTQLIVPIFDDESGPVRSRLKELRRTFAESVMNGLLGTKAKVVPVGDDTAHVAQPDLKTYSAMLDVLEQRCLSLLRDEVLKQMVEFSIGVLDRRNLELQPSFSQDEEELLIGMNSLHSHLRKLVDLGLRKHFKATLASSVAKLVGTMKANARPLHQLAAVMDSYELALRQKLEGMPGCFFVASGSLRDLVLRTHLGQATGYSISDGAWTSRLLLLGMAWRRTRRELSHDVAELEFLLEKLTKLEDEKISEATWRDVTENWQSILSLRSKFRTERAQAVLECILSDPSIASSLGCAHALMKTCGSIPPDLLNTLSNGPGMHIRQNAFRYRNSINQELFRIGRVKDVQLRFIALIGSAIIAALVGIANFVSRVLYASIYGN